MASFNADDAWNVILHFVDGNFGFVLNLVKAEFYYYI